MTWQTELAAAREGAERVLTEAFAQWPKRLQFAPGLLHLTTREFTADSEILDLVQPVPLAPLVSQMATAAAEPMLDPSRLDWGWTVTELSIALLSSDRGFFVQVLIRAIPFTRFLEDQASS